MLNGRKGQAVADINWVQQTEWPISPNGRARSIRLIDLFCGCGGLTLGVWEAARLRNYKIDIRLAVDAVEQPLSVYRENFARFQSEVRQDDIGRIFNGRRSASPTSIERYWLGRAGEVDLIVAGPPCQGHSDLNNSTRRNDPRNELYLKAVRAAEVFTPKALIIENVPAVVLDKKGVVKDAINWLQGIGYSVSERVVSLLQFGVPQLRRRHILVATYAPEFCLGELKEEMQSELTAGQYLAGLEDEADYDAAPFYRPGKMTAENVHRVDYLFSKNLHDLPDSKRPACHRDKKHAYVSMYGRMHWDKPAQTLTSGFGSMGQGRFVHPTRRRLLSPHEAARLQGFPDFFDFSSARTLTSLREMIANAVPPQFTAQLVIKLIDAGVI